MEGKTMKKPTKQDWKGYWKVTAWGTLVSIEFIAGFLVACFVMDKLTKPAKNEKEEKDSE